MGKFLRSNWFNVVTVLFAVVAVILSAQANNASREANALAQRSIQLSEEAASPHVTIVSTESLDHDYFTYLGCKGQAGIYFRYVTLREGYQSRLMTQRQFTISNAGGRATSLLSVELRTAEQPSYEHTFAVKVFQTPLQLTAPWTPVQLPIDLEPGIGRNWSIAAVSDNAWNTKQEAIDANDSISQTLKSPLLWVFQFDSTVITKEVKAGIVIKTLPSSLNTMLESDCGALDRNMRP
jgi:hypothetical protein